MFFFLTDLFIQVLIVAVKIKNAKSVIFKLFK